MISSRPWTVEPKVKPTTALKRKTVSTTTTSTAAPPQPGMAREVTERGTMSQPEAKAAVPMDKTEIAVREADWPFGGGGVKWAEVEGEESWAKGSAVVEEEEVVTEPRRIFEEIFDFDK